MPDLSTLVVSLIDPVAGQTIQSWRFTDRPMVTIGRSVTCDISIGHPLVSRVHVELHCRAGAWRFESSGRHGTLVEGEMTTTGPIATGTRIQLGSTGPLLQMAVLTEDDLLADSGRGPDEEGHTTMFLDVSLLQRLKVDQGRKEQEVQSIADSEHFARLKEQAQALRRTREEE